MNPPNLPVIFDYFDCAKYLRDYYDARHAKDRWFSYRFIQSKTGIDPGYLFKVFLGRKFLPKKKIEEVAALLDLNRRETEYFGFLSLYSRAKSPDEIRLYFEKMLSYREVTTRKVEAKEYEYYSKWYYAALRQIFSYYRFQGNYEELAKMTIPPISASEAKKAVAVLDKLGFIEKTPEGSYQVTDRFLSTGEEWQSIAVRRFQQDTIMLASQALDRIDKEYRDISTVTVTLSAEAFCEAKERIRQFRRDMLDLANREGRPGGAYHMNIQLIPIGKGLEEGGQ
jgi:uncharacterized protein (TIGR02147 family)